MQRNSSLSGTSSEDDESSPPRALVFLFNAVKVKDAEVPTWPGLHKCTVVERRDLGVPLQPGLSPSDRSANVLVCVLAVVRGAVELKLGVVDYVLAACTPNVVSCQFIAFLVFPF